MTCHTVGLLLASVSPLKLRRRAKKGGGGEWGAWKAGAVSATDATITKTATTTATLEVSSLCCLFMCLSVCLFVRWFEFNSRKRFRSVQLGTYLYDSCSNTRRMHRCVYLKVCRGIPPKREKMIRIVMSINLSPSVSVVCPL